MQGTNLVDSIGGSPVTPIIHQKNHSLSLISMISSIPGGKSCGICPHDNCIISAIRGARQGLYYGGKVRFAHSLVMQVLFGKGSLISKLKTSIELSWQHGRNLGVFVFIYKLV